MSFHPGHPGLFRRLSSCALPAVFALILVSASLFRTAHAAPPWKGDGPSAFSAPSTATAAAVFAAPAGGTVVASTPCRHPDALRERACLDSLARLCRQPGRERERRCLDSLARAHGLTPEELGGGGTAAAARAEPGAQPQAGTAANAALLDDGSGEEGGEEGWDEDEVRKERTRGYIGGFFYDASRSDLDLDSDDWAAFLFVFIGIIAVGAFLLFGLKAVWDLVVNKDGSPVIKEAGLRYSYSGLAMRAHDGAPLYRDAHLLGARFAIGVDKGLMAVGIAAEGGSINLGVSRLDRAAPVVDVHGGYLVAGPMVRFGDYRPLALSFEFLNGTSDHRSIGLISKSRMALQGKVGGGLIVGAHLGAVFYDLRIADGLVFRRGDLNRDLSLMAGADIGWDF
jgi:hypothetical protein